MTRRGRLLVFILLIAALAWAAYSLRSGGLVGVLVAATRDSDRSLDLLRAYFARWGVLAPVVYTLAVVVETVVAPIPGALLYAPGGALFGGALGGTLSLAGNVLGATIACVLARTFGERLAARLDASSLARLGAQLRARGF